MKKVVVLLIISSLLLTGCSIKKVEELSDKEKFAKEYNISKDNCFVYADYDKVLELLENQIAIILFANSDDENSRILNIQSIGNKYDTLINSLNNIN